MVLMLVGRPRFVVRVSRGAERHGRGRKSSNQEEGKACFADVFHVWRRVGWRLIQKIGKDWRIAVVPNDCTEP